ncbi:MAG: alpha/beta fold hydrolase [Candidatus Dormibacteraeota bacterium]|nr:alpha/beta fold hydrolase [Candidatus Dormibacteraeota bacterium]
MSKAKVGPARSGFAEVDGGKLWYEVAGQGPPLVLIHSGITDSRSWDPQIAVFSQDFKVLRYDMRGFGQSDVTHGEYSARADLLAVMDAAGIRVAALVGVSMGSSLAIDVALEHPDRVSALVVVGPGFSGRKQSDAFKALMRQVDQIFEEKGLDATIEREMEIWLYGKGRTAADVDPDVRAAVFAMDRFNSERFPADMKARPLEPPAVERLADIRVPTLIVAGDRDLPDVMDAAEQLESGIKGARRLVMRGTAHVPNMEQPEVFNRIVLEFLDGAPKPKQSGR